MNLPMELLRGVVGLEHKEVHSKEPLRKLSVIFKNHDII